MDLRRTIIILMAVACVITTVGVIHCHVNDAYPTQVSAYRTVYSIIFPILLTMTSFLLIEQMMVTDGTVAPLNRLRTVYAFAAAIVLLIFGIVATIVASRRYALLENVIDYHDAVIAAVIAFVGMMIYITEGLARYRKNRFI